VYKRLRYIIITHYLEKNRRSSVG